MKRLTFCSLLVLVIGCAFQKNKKERYASYFPSGKIKAITEMENGMKNGREELYFENGNLFMLQYFKDDFLVDSFYQYDKDTPNLIVFKGYSTYRTRTVTLYVDNNVFSETD